MGKKLEIDEVDPEKCYEASGLDMALILNDSFIFSLGCYKYTHKIISRHPKAQMASAILIILLLKIILVACITGVICCIS